MKFTSMLVAAFVFAASAAIAGPTPSLFTYDTQSVFKTVSQQTGVEGADIGTLAVGFGAFGLATDPVTGLTYVSYQESGTWKLGTVDVGTGAITEIGQTADYRLRGLVFDKRGKLWGVTGSQGTAAHVLVSVDKGTAAVTVEIPALGGPSRLKIAYHPGTDTLYLLAFLDPGWGMFSLSPADPQNTAAPIALSGATLGGSSMPGGFVYDNGNGVLVTVHDADGGTDENDMVAITTTGVVIRIAESQVTGEGLAFDQAGTIPVELSEFAIE